MHYDKAKETLQQALAGQKTIAVPKLKRLLMELNVTLEPTKDKEVRYLKKEIKKLARRVRYYEQSGVAERMETYGKTNGHTQPD